MPGLHSHIRKERVYFATLSTIDGLQVERVFLLTAIFKKGVPMQFSNEEVCRLWLNAKGQSAVTSKARNMGIYRDCFKWDSKIALRGMNDVHHVLANAWVCPRYKVIPELRRNYACRSIGCFGRIHDSVFDEILILIYECNAP